MSFVFDIAAGNQANAIGKFNQKIANRNSEIATQEAEAEKKLIDFNLSKFNQQFEELQATSRVNTSFSVSACSALYLKTFNTLPDLSAPDTAAATFVDPTNC